MGTISVSLPSDGSTAEVADYNTPITTIVNEINGELDNANISASAAIDGSKLAASSIPNTALAGGITPDKLSLGAQTASVATSQTTTSTSYTDLATTGPSVTVTVPTGGAVMVIIGCAAYNSNADRRNDVSFSMSGANSVTSTTQGDTNRRRIIIRETTAAEGTNYGTWLLTGLTPGSTTFTMQYRVQSDTGTFMDRFITVIPIG